MSAAVERRFDGRRVGEIDEREMCSAALGKDAELFERAVVTLLRGHEEIATREELEHRHVGGQARGESRGTGAAFEAREAGFERGAVRCALAAVAVASRVGTIGIALEG